MHRSVNIIAGIGILTLLSAAGCGGNKEESQTAYNQQPQQYPQQQQQYPQQQQQYPQQQQQYPQQQQQYPQQQQQYPQQQQQQQYPQQGTPQTGTPQAAAGGAAQPVDASMAATVQPALVALGKTQAPAGAKAFGNMIVANFAQGQMFEQSIQLQANKCYTVVAAGLPGVSEVNIKLMPPMIPTTLAQDNSTGPQATLGGSPNCWKNGPLPAPMRILLEVPAGQGIVAAQIYEK